MLKECSNEASSSSGIDDVARCLKDDEVADDFSRLLLHDLHFVKESFEAVQYKASQVIAEVNQALNKFAELMLTMPQERTEEENSDLHQLKKKVFKLKSSIPFNLIAPSELPNPNINLRPRSDDLYRVKKKTSSCNPNTYDDDCKYYYDKELWDSSDLTYDEIESVIHGLRYSSGAINFLLCFVTFPENAVIKRSLLLCWVDVVMWNDFYFTFQAMDELIEKRIIQAVHKKSSMAVAGYRLHPSLHSTLKLNKRWCGMSSPIDIYFGRSLDVEDDEDIFHTEEDFEQIMQTKEFEILYLGRWNKYSNEQHIEVVNPKLFFAAMLKQTRLRFVSLRGISMIEELPDSMTKLGWLMILDLKSCHNLEVIPSSIANLRNSLKHLDISECYLLDRLPKALAKLVKLNVLKGFIVGESDDASSCSLEDLVDLKQLQELNIYTSMKGFPNTSQLETLQKFKKLYKLTISWGGCSAMNELRKSRKTTEARLKNMLTLKEPVVGDHETLSFSSILKLDLQCVPETVTRRWLKPANFENLKKLYIRGGQFFDLGPSRQGSQWNVEILRLKHLSKLDIDWCELQHLFPKMISLEKVHCPNLYQFPCDNHGIWKKNK